MNFEDGNEKQKKNKNNKNLIYNNRKAKDQQNVERCKINFYIRDVLLSPC